MYRADRFRVNIKSNSLVEVKDGRGKLREIIPTTYNINSEILLLNKSKASKLLCSLYILYTNFKCVTIRAVS